MSLNVLAEKHVKVCGQLKYEKSYENGVDESRYTIQYSMNWNDWQDSVTNYRFELIFLKPGQKRYLKSLMNKIEGEKLANVCAEVFFSGRFDWTGFDAGGVRLYSGKVVNKTDIEYSYSSDNN